MRDNSVGSHGVAAVVPHVLIVYGDKVLRSHLVDKPLGRRIQAGAGSYRVKIGGGLGAGVHQGVVIGSCKQPLSAASRAAFPGQSGPY